ncbi:MAG: glycosyltransferase family 2 protein [Dehalococcoidales bacterium]|nr:glycosyltransferase family 2 protein [Dehalococcoidales bacterium]
MDTKLDPEAVPANIENMLSIVIPTYNEQDNIIPLTERLSRTLAGRDYEILLVDDNSKDRTVEVAAGLADKYPIKVLVRKREKGLATAVLHGFKYARGNIIGVMDADLQHPPEINAALLKALDNGADMAVASRYVPGGGVPNWGLLRRIISKGASTIAHVFLPSIRKVKDPMSGFFMFKREKVEGVEFKPTGYKILLEMLVMGKFQNVVEVPFIFEDRSSGRSKMKARQQLDYLQHILSLMRRKGELVRILKFLAVGLSGTAVNIGILRLVTATTSWSKYVALVPGIEVSIITNFLLNDFFTFSDRRTGKTGSFFARLLKYNMVSLSGAVINYAVAALLFSVGLNIYLADFIGILIAFIWNFLFSTLWTWK